MRGDATEATPVAGSFGDDVAFLSQYTDVIVLSDEAGQARIAVVPQYQGRVMTSTTGGESGPSFGWINRELIASGERLPHMNPFGGEDRFWLGPEGGQFGLYFKPGDPFDFEHWQVPSFIDTEPFHVAWQMADHAVFSGAATLVNHLGTEFSVAVARTVRLLTNDQIQRILSVPDLTGVSSVGYVSMNTLVNTGTEAWTKDTGLLSVWILGMFNPSPETTVILPIESGSEAERGPMVNDLYFGKVPADRLRVTESHVFFRGDGQYRSKIGVSPRRAKPVCGSYDAGERVLTVVQFNRPAGATDYVNSMWAMQEAPYAGDVVNSYNDGPPEPGAKPMGPFYELETSSPAAALGPGEAITHIHRTFHFVGDEAALDGIAERVLGTGLAEVKGAF